MMEPTPLPIAPSKRARKRAARRGHQWSSRRCPPRVEQLEDRNLLSAGGLAPGQHVSLTLSFSNPKNAHLHFTPHVVEANGLA